MKPLKFSEYRIQQALWLQQEYSKDKMTSRNHSAFLLEQYIEYARICGYDDSILWRIRKFIPKVNYIAYSFDGHKKPYIKWIEENITRLMDMFYDKYMSL